MHTHEFCYWLQGYFELREIDEELTIKQIECIEKHIKLVNEVAPDSTGKFVPWLEGVLDSCIYRDKDTTFGLTSMIIEKLSKCFEHEIDKKYKVNLDKLNKIHNFPKPAKPFDPFEPIRC